jgi:drug/metabolite transporter (DMT)-like permease
LFVAVFGALAFGEPLRPRLAVSLACCLAGAACVVGDGSGADWRGDAMALGSALLSGLAVNIVRRLSAAGENPFAIYLFPCLFGLPLLAIAPAPPGGLAGPGLVPLFCLLGVGAGAFAAQALMARGYRTVAAGRGSVVFYWETGLTVALGALLAGERPNLRFFVGLALILAGLRVNQKS